MNLVIVTTGSRPDLLRQTLKSLHDNAATPEAHTITLVIDGAESLPTQMPIVTATISSHARRGASASRNSGAGSIPRYSRHEHVMFCDDDIYAVKDWDVALQRVAKALPAKTILSGYGHPYNIDECYPGVDFAGFPGVISSVAMMMPWSAFDEIGYWTEPGGPGGSEDVDLCARAAKLGYEFAVTTPHVIIHTGMTSSSGGKIVGYELLMNHNEALYKHYGLQGKVRYY